MNVKKLIKLRVEINQNIWGNLYIRKHQRITFINNLRRYRELTKLTLKQCCKFTCIPEKVWINLESNPKSIKLHVAQVICEFLEIKTMDLFTPPMKDTIVNIK